jgi:hypothetical protein
MKPSRSQLLPFLLLLTILSALLLYTTYTASAWTPAPSHDSSHVVLPVFALVEKLQRIYGPQKTLSSNGSPSETCSVYRSLHPDIPDRNIGVAGLFNTGTNLLTSLLVGNCAFPSHSTTFNLRAGMGSVLWGKHNPYSYRANGFVSPRMERLGVSEDSYMVVVIAKDPLTWIKSMCERAYSVVFADASNCAASSLSIKYGDGATKVYANLARLYVEWYSMFLVDKSKPWLLVRYEDLLMYEKDTVRLICECVGGSFNHETYKHVEGSSKGSTGSNRMQSFVKYSDEAYRHEGFTEDERAHLRDSFGTEEDLGWLYDV